MTLGTTFADALNKLRKANHLTVYELAKRAGVPQSLISGLQTGNRQIGEYVARKLAKVLQLENEELEDFVYLAINDCSEKVLQRSKDYPAEVLNLIAGELHNRGIFPDSIMGCVRKPSSNTDAALYLNDGKAALINLEIAYR